MHATLTNLKFTKFLGYEGEPQEGLPVVAADSPAVFQLEPTGDMVPQFR